MSFCVVHEWAFLFVQFEFCHPEDKKHGNGITVESIISNGFGEEFIGADPKNRPESGKLVMDMAKTYFQGFVLQIIV